MRSNGEEEAPKRNWLCLVYLCNCTIKLNFKEHHDPIFDLGMRYEIATVSLRSSDDIITPSLIVSCDPFEMMILQIRVSCDDIDTTRR